MDGVLYDSNEKSYLCVARSNEKVWLRRASRDDLSIRGMRGVETIQILMREQRNETIDEDEALRMYNEKARVFETLPTAPIMPGVLKLMHKN